MKTLNGIALEYKNTKRNNYMSLTDLAQDLTTETLIKVLENENKLSKQMTIMSEIDKRNELSDDKYFELLEKCNGI
jgi:hypothetical protein